MKKFNWLILLFIMLGICVYSYGDDPEPEPQKGTMVDDLHFDDYVYTVDQADAEFGKAVQWTPEEFEYTTKIGELTIGNQTNEVVIPDVVTNLNILITDSDPQLKTPENVDDLIQNQQRLIEILKEYSGIEDTQSPSASSHNRDGEFQSFLLSENPGGGIFTNAYFDGHYETNNIVTFFPFYSVGKKFINFGTDFPVYNTGVSIFGLADEWNGVNPPVSPALPIPGSNSYPETIKIINDGFTRSGAASETEYDPLANAEKFTIMAWVYRNEANVSASRVMADLAGTTDGPGVQLRFAAGGRLDLFINPANSSDAATGPTNDVYLIGPNSTNWYHIAVSFDSNAAGSTEDRTVNFYIMGDKHNPGGTKRSYRKGEVVQPNTAAFTVGASSGGDTYMGQFYGYMDDLIVFRDWVPMDYNGYTIPGTTKVWTDEDIVKFWMNMDDAILDEPDVSGLSVDFGQFNPRDPIYSSDQVNKLLGISEEGAREILGEDPTKFGQFGPRTNIYSAEEFDDLKDKYWRH